MTPKEIAEKFGGKRPGEFRVDQPEFMEYIGALVYVALGKAEPGVRAEDVVVSWDLRKHKHTFRWRTPDGMFVVQKVDPSNMNLYIQTGGFPHAVEIISGKLLLGAAKGRACESA